MDKQEKEKLYNELITKYDTKQIVVAIEEMSELSKELCKTLRGKNDNKEQIEEELADVVIMLEQMKMYYGIDTNKLNEVIDSKLARTKERLLGNDTDNQSALKGNYIYLKEETTNYDIVSFQRQRLLYKADAKTLEDNIGNTDAFIKCEMLKCGVNIHSGKIESVERLNRGVPITLLTGLNGSSETEWNEAYKLVRK